MFMLGHVEIGMICTTCITTKLQDNKLQEKLPSVKAPLVFNCQFPKIRFLPVHLHQSFGLKP